MTKKNEDRRLLDNWVPPTNAGLAIGCLATTYTFQSDFFEEECLTRFLNIESKADEDGPIYLIEREEKLNNVSCVAVWVDQAWARQKRNLRWDLVPVRLTRGILHSKISVFHWVNCVRIIIGSANITETAYRKNQEIFAVIDLSSNTTDDKNTAAAFVDHLVNIINADTFISDVIKNKHLNFLKGALRFIETLPGGDSNIRRAGYLTFPILIEPKGESFPEQVSKIWNSYVNNTPPEDCFITSPFFDPPEEKNLPATRLWEILKKKGRACVDIYTTGELDIENNPYRIHAPQSINDSIPEGRNDVALNWHILPEIEDEGKNNRPLHLKSYWFEHNNGWRLLVFGSSNFSSKGWGLLPSSNYEANIAYLTNEFSYKEQFDKATKTFIDSEIIDTNNIKWEPLLNEEEAGEINETPLPPFFQSATLVKNENLFIELKFLTSKPPEYFSIRNEEGTMEYFNYKQWHEAGSPDTYRIPIETLSIPAYLLVYINENEVPACLTINVISQECLPPPDELKNLPLDILTQIITSASPLHQVLRKYLLQNGRKTAENVELINPHDRVDTSTFLLQKTRRYSLAINTIKTKLEQPCPTLSSLDWRLYGPVGLEALTDAMQREAGDNTSEAIFFLTELWNQLTKIAPPAGEGILSPKVVLNKLNEFQIELAQRIKQLWSSSEIESIQNYSSRILEKSLS